VHGASTARRRGTVIEADEASIAGVEQSFAGRALFSNV
jgi:hypothetical protein